MFSNNQYPQPSSGNPSQPQQLLEVFDELETYQRTQVKKLIPIEEQIFYSGVVEKINKNLVCQKRILVITNKSLYNIQPDDDGLIQNLIISLSPSSALKRKINIRKIFGITLSVNPQADKEQFIIHVTGEYDYRYNAGKKRERIIKTLMNLHWCQVKTPFVLFMKEDNDLAKYHVTEDDHKNHIDKRPKDGQILVTQDMMANGLSWLIANRYQFIQAPKPKPQPQFIQTQRPIIQNVITQTMKPIYTNQPLTKTYITTQPAIRIQPTIQVVQKVVPTTGIIVTNTVPTRQVVITTQQPRVIVTNPNMNYAMNAQMNTNIQPNMGNVQPQTYSPQQYIPQPTQNSNTQPQSSNNYQPDFIHNDLISSTHNNVNVTTNFESTLGNNNAKKY